MNLPRQMHTLTYTSDVVILQYHTYGAVTTVSLWFKKTQVRAGTVKAVVDTWNNKQKVMITKGADSKVKI